MNKITHKNATKIARLVLKYCHSGVDPRTIDMNDQIDGHLAEIDLGWRLKDNTYIDGLACEFITVLSKDIRNSAIEKYSE